MDIDATGMPIPDLLFILGRLCGQGMVLLNLEITDWVASSAQGCQELGSVVLQRLTPLGMGGADG